MASLDDLERLSRYLAGELGPEETRQVEAALQASPELAQALARMRALDDAASELPPTLGEAEAEALIAQVRPPRRHGSAWLKGACAAALLAGIVAAALAVRARPGGELVAVEGEVEVSGNPVAPLASRDLQLADVVRTGRSGTALVHLRDSSILVRQGTRFAVSSEPAQAELLEGTVLASSRDLTLASKAGSVHLAGRALVTVEPGTAPGRVTEANDELAAGGDTMKPWLKNAGTAAIAAAAGGLLTVVVLEGHATAEGAGGPQVAIAEGQRWRSGDAAASRAADPAPLQVATRALAQSTAPAAPPRPEPPAAAPRPLPEFEEFDALQKKVQELEKQLAEERQLREIAEGKPLTPPADLPPRFSQENLRSAISAGFQELGWKNQITSVDCTEYPCIVYGDGSLNRNEWNTLYASGAFQGYQGDNHYAWGWNDGEQRRFAIVLQPKQTPGTAKQDSAQRLQFRVRQMQEATK